MNQIESQGSKQTAEKMNVATECLTLVKNEWKLIKNISLLLNKKMVDRETKETFFLLSWAYAKKSRKAKQKLINKKQAYKC